jgi:hypothetical protein
MALTIWSIVYARSVCCCVVNKGLATNVVTLVLRGEHFDTGGLEQDYRLEAQSSVHGSFVSFT